MFNDLVLISQSALQLCDISIGDPVIVDICGVSTVKTAWPTLEKSLVSVFMTKQGNIEVVIKIYELVQMLVFMAK